MPAPLSSDLPGYNKAAVFLLVVGWAISTTSPVFMFNSAVKSGSILTIPLPASSLKASFTLNLFPSLSYPLVKPLIFFPVY